MRWTLIALLTVIMCGTSLYGTTLSLPANNAILNEYNPELSWVADSDAERTRIQVSTDSSFTAVICDDEIYGVVNRFVPVDDLDARDYWWRAQAKSKTTQTWGSWTSAWKFTVANNTVVNIYLTDSVSTLRSKILNCSNNRRIVFQYGTYNFDAGEVENLDFFAKLNNKTNVVLDGNGSTIVFEGRIINCGFASITNSQNVTIKNFKIQRTYKLALPLEIKSVNTTSGYFICERINSNYPLPAEDNYQYSADSGFVLDKDTKKIKFGTPLTLFNNASTSGVYNTTQWRYYLASGYTGYINNLRAGDIYMKDEKYGNDKEIYAVSDHNLTIYNVDTDNTGLTFHLSADKCDNVKVLRCDWLRDGLMGPVSDGMHFTDLRGGAWIEENTIESNGDDDIAVLPVQYGFTRINDTTIEVSDSHDIEVGDVLHFFVDSSYGYSKQLSVTSVTDVGTNYRLTLSGGTVTTNLTSYCNYDLAGPGTVIRNNTFDCSRGDTFHMTLDGAIFEDNLLLDIGERAFTFTPTTGGGSYSRNIRINNNVFNNLRRSAESGTWGTFLMIKNGSLSSYLHDNIRFEDNTCFGYPNCALQIWQAKNVYVTGNHFSSGEYNGSADTSQDIVQLNYTDNVFIQNNRFVEHRNRSTSEYLDLVNASGWSTDNPNFDSQFVINLWNLSKINHSETGSIFYKGTAAPARSYTRVKLIGSGTMNGGGTTDKCTFANVNVSNDCDLKMKVYSLTVPSTTDYAKGGLMFRETTDANSKFAFMEVREAGGGYSVQYLYRSTTGGGLATGATTAISGFPVYLSITRSGNSFIGQYSYDDVNWTQLNTQTISMNADIKAGVAVTSQATGQLTTLDGDELSANY